MARRKQTQSRTSGLTLVEVLVALALWGLMTALLTQGVDGITRSQRHQIERSDAHARLQTSLSQWQTDLSQIDTDNRLMPTLDWNGQVLRLIRHSPAPHAGQRTVVAWGVHAGRWVRWQSPALSHPAEVLQAWGQALQALTTAADLGGEPAPAGVPAQGWQLFFFHEDSWGNALSSRGSTASQTPGDHPNSGGAALPDAIRLQLELQPQGDWQGRLNWDWVRPTWGVTRS